MLTCASHSGALLTSATSPAALLDQQVVPQLRQLGLERAQVVIRGLVLLSWTSQASRQGAGRNRTCINFMNTPHMSTNTRKLDSLRAISASISFIFSITPIFYLICKRLDFDVLFCVGYGILCVYGLG